MKNKNTRVMLMVVTVVVLVSSIACSPIAVVDEAELVEEAVSQEMEVETVGSEPASEEPVHVTQSAAAPEDAPVSDGVLTEVEIEGLLFMREEEKLAGDVYRYFYDLWGNNIFQNIARSEDTHTNAVLDLLNQYGVADPALAEPGVFSNPELQALYDELTALGSQSVKDALLVGAAIEEIDILDIEEYIAQTDEADIQLVYENLIAGSENHLRAFVRVIGNQTGESYIPQYLTQEAYDEIVQSENGAGNGQAGNGNGRWQN